MTVRTLTIIVVGSLFVLPSVLCAQEGSDLLRSSGRTSWDFDLTTGYDATLHSYALATEDTSETIAEFMVQAGLRGQSARGARHRWRVRGEASTGTELWREKLEGDYRYLDTGGITRLRFIGRFWGRQFRDNTSFTRSSNNWEGRLEGRGSPWAGGGAALDLRAWGNFIDYRNPSTLEVDYKDTGVGVFARSRGTSLTNWSGGVRRSARVYPDSSAIDRDTWSVEGDFDSHDLDGRGVRLYHKSSHRRIADETVRPSAWTHWTDLYGAVGAGAGNVVLEIQNEIWKYDEETGAYFNSWRADTFLGYRWGDILEAVWQRPTPRWACAPGSTPTGRPWVGNSLSNTGAGCMTRAR